MKEKIQSKRELLDKLVLSNEAKLTEGEILEISKQLDLLIAEYYENVTFKY